MHAFGDFDDEHNSQAAECVQEYLINTWLPYFSTNHLLNYTKLEQKYRLLIDEYTSNLNRKHDIMKKLDVTTGFNTQAFLENQEDKILQELMDYIPEESDHLPQRHPVD